MLKGLSVIFTALLLSIAASGQVFVADINRDSARSDKLTGGHIEKTHVVPGDDKLRITINVPSFQMTLWQNGKEVKTYPVGVGMPDWPIYIGRREASSIEWNPVWIPPSSEWIEASTRVKAGEVILPTDPRNPLGKMKIPLGYGYLIHQAKGPGDLGSLVSHGCVRVIQADLYDISEKIVLARRLNITSEQIAFAKRSKETMIAPLDPAIPVEITYDTLVVESGRLHIYPDVYAYRKNTVENLRRELRTSGIDDRRLKDDQIKRFFTQAMGKRQFTIRISDVVSGTVSRGQTVPVVASGTVAVRPKPRSKRRTPSKRH